MQKVIVEGFTFKNEHRFGGVARLEPLEYEGNSYVRMFIIESNGRNGGCDLSLTLDEAKELIKALEIQL